MSSFQKKLIEKKEFDNFFSFSGRIVIISVKEDKWTFVPAKKFQWNRKMRFGSFFDEIGANSKIDFYVIFEN